MERHYGTAGSPKYVTEVRVWVHGFGPLTDAEAQTKAWELWRSLSFKEQRAIERSGTDAHIALHSGVAGLVQLRDALEAIQVVA